jgi:hypothetical protein
VPVDQHIKSIYTGSGLSKRSFLDSPMTKKHPKHYGLTAVVMKEEKHDICRRPD